MRPCTPVMPCIFAFRIAIHLTVALVLHSLDRASALITAIEAVSLTLQALGESATLGKCS